jgi:membrane fusion protein, multidrug efflux system
MTSLQTFRLGVLAALVFALAGCGEDNSSKGAKGAPPAPQVTVALPVKRTVTDRDEYVGRFVAIDSVEIRSRVSGYLDKVQFTDGELVKRGDRLFQIDQRPFMAALDQARADLARAKAQLDLASADLVRAQDLIDRKTISEAVYEQRIQAKRAADAQMESAEASVRVAELNLEFTELRAPIDGRIGDRRVSPGNLVIGGSQPSTTLLATIVSTDPIRFEFTFDEAAFLRYSRLAKNGNNIESRGTSAPVELRLLDETEYKHRGKMDFVDNVIDRASGTIRGRALLDNPSGIFTPGMFARARVPASAPFEALLVPDTAIGTEQVRKFVYAVDEDNTVRQKYVTLGQLENGLRVILEGVGPEDRIIVNGMVRARPGIKVTPVKEGEKPAAAGAAAASAAK